MIAVTFAIPQESRAFQAALRRAGLGSEAIRVVHTGIGRAAAAGAMRTLLAEHQPTAIVASGFAGALDPALRIGDVIVATNRSSPAFLECCRARWKSDGRMVFGPLETTDRVVEGVEEKAQLARSSAAVAVDMETSAIHAACLEAGVPLLAFRAISDTVDRPIPLPFAISYDLERQRPRPLATAWYLARNPRAVWPLAHFVQDLGLAGAELARRLVEILDDVRSGAERPPRA